MYAYYINACNTYIHVPAHMSFIYMSFILSPPLYVNAYLWYACPTSLCQCICIYQWMSFLLSSLCISLCLCQCISLLLSSLCQCTSLYQCISLSQCISLCLCQCISFLLSSLCQCISLYQWCCPYLYINGIIHINGNM